jgi:hypothetical protein
MRNKYTSKKPPTRGKRRGSKRRDCICEETLELYVLERLPGQQRAMADDPEVAAIEIHLLVCEHCQARAETLEAETRQLRAILRRLAEPAKPKTFRAGG